MHRRTLGLLCLAWLAAAPVARAQPCGSRECEIGMLRIGPSHLADAAQRITALRRVARDERATPGERVAALREEADLFASLAHRARRARELGALDEASVRAFERAVGRRPEALDAGPVARACVALARDTFAWALDAGRCRSLVRGVHAEGPIEERLALPFVPRAFAEARHGDVARATYREVLARAERGDVRAQLELAAIQLLVGRSAEALATIEALPDRSSYDAQLVWAEAAAARGRLVEALAVAVRLAREAPSRSDAVFDAMTLTDAVRAPSDRAASARVLAAAQHLLCLGESVDEGLRESALDLGMQAADELGLDSDRPLVPLRHLPHHHVDQERARPLATCARARRQLVRGTASVPAPIAPACPDGALRGFDDEGEPAGWILRGGRLARVPSACLRDDGAADVDEAGGLVDRFDVGDLDADGRADVARVADATDGTYVTGREVTLLSGGDPARVIATLRDESTRFGARVLPAGDVDHDGRPDLIVTRPSACDCCECGDTTDDALLYVWREGALRSSATIRGASGLYNWIRALGVGDVDRDGFDDVVIAHGAEVRLHRGRRDGIDPAGIVLHRRESDSDSIALGRGDARGVWWWIDPDAGAAWIVRGARVRRARLP